MLLRFSGDVSKGDCMDRIFVWRDVIDSSSLAWKRRKLPLTTCDMWFQSFDVLLKVKTLKPNLVKLLSCVTQRKIVPGEIKQFFMSKINLLRLVMGKTLPMSSFKFALVPTSIRLEFLPLSGRSADSFPRAAGNRFEARVNSYSWTIGSLIEINCFSYQKPKRYAYRIQGKGEICGLFASFHRGPVEEHQWLRDPVTC